MSLNKMLLIGNLGETRRCATCPAAIRSQTSA